LRFNNYTSRWAAAAQMVKLRAEKEDRLLLNNIGVNRFERTLEIQDRSTNRVYKVKVPLNMQPDLTNFRHG